MKKLLVLTAAAALLLSTLSGCSPSGSFVSANLSQTELSSGNYRIVATNVKGEAEAGYLIGFTYSVGGLTSTLALARVSGSSALYDDALQSLWKDFEDSHGSASGRRLALVNVRYDSDNLNLILYTGAKIMIRADVVEFED